jgi:hypothetical protein
MRRRTRRPAPHKRFADHKTAEIRGISLAHGFRSDRSNKWTSRHRTNIMRKLNLSSRHELVKYVLRRGLFRDSSH